jgi:hypothetical protein
MVRWHLAIIDMGWAMAFSVQKLAIVNVGWTTTFSVCKLASIDRV